MRGAPKDEPTSERTWRAEMRQMFDTHYVPFIVETIERIIRKKITTRKVVEAELLGGILNDLGYLPRPVDWMRDDPVAAVTWLRARLGLGGVADLPAGEVDTNTETAILLAGRRVSEMEKGEQPR